MSSRSSDRRSAGILLGALLAADQAPRALERLEAEARRRCQRELDALGAVDRQARLARTRELAAQLMLPGPQRIALLHPSWLTHALSEEHPAVAAAVVEALPSALAARLAPRAGRCGLPAAARLRLVQKVLAPFEGLDGPPLEDAALERWLVGDQASFVVVLERLAARDPEQVETSHHALDELEPEAQPLALGSLIAAAVLDAQGAGARLLWRLPRSVGRWLEKQRGELSLDQRWPAMLAASLEEPSWVEPS